MSLSRLIFPIASRVRGLYQRGPYLVPLTAKAVLVDIPRDVAWKRLSAETVYVGLDFSPDGGVSWIVPLVGFGAIGGRSSHVTGRRALTSSIHVLLPQSGNPDRRVRIRLEHRTRQMDLSCSLSFIDIV